MAGILQQATGQLLGHRVVLGEQDGEWPLGCRQLGQAEAVDGCGTPGPAQDAGKVGGKLPRDGGVRQPAVDAGVVAELAVRRGGADHDDVQLLQGSLRARATDEVDRARLDEVVIDDREIEWSA